MLKISKEFNGPPSSGNGGYCCGLFARSLISDPTQGVEVTLRSPPPLDTALQAIPVAGGMEIRDQDTLVADVKPLEFTFEPRPAPQPHLAREAERRYPAFTGHPFPSCFVCGPQRTAGDGLRLFPGSLAEQAVAGEPVACHWQPYASLADQEGFLKPEFVWAALDCPTYFGAFNGEANVPAVLGRQAVRLLQPRLPADAGYIIQSWLLQQDGRKSHSVGALYLEQGSCVALCRATWVRLQ